MAILEDLINDGVPDPAKRAEILRQLGLRTQQTSFGLVFERHFAENVALPTYPIRKGINVRYRSELGGEIWKLQTVADGLATIQRTLEDGTDEERTDVDITDLVAIRGLNEAIYAGLKPVGSINRGGCKPAHVVINAENMHALELLYTTHLGKVDCIYIDPPYNTGNTGWIYGDRIVDSSDSFAHSLWLSFMERRLVMAHALLKPTGVIIVAIDDNEQANLKVLLNQIFGEKNFLNTLIWQGGYDARSRFASRGHDYMHIFARKIDALTEAGVKWTEEKQGLEELTAAGAEIWQASGRDTGQATKQLRAWIKDHEDSLSPGLKQYSHIDAEGRVYRADNLSCPASGTPYWYDLMHPETGLPVKKPSKGWRHSPARADENLAQGRILFGKDHGTIPQYKRFITDSDNQVPRTVFEADRSRARKHLQKVLGEDRFPYPKDVEVLQRWIGMIAPEDGVILDFFGGSGSTSEAVLRLNAADGGTRQSILVTNNELADKDAKALTKAGYRDGDPEWEAKGVFEYVTKPRLETVVTGIRPNGTTYSDGMSENIKFFELTYEDRAWVEMGRRFKAIAPVLWLQSGGVGPIIAERPENQGWALQPGASYGILFDTAEVARFLDAVAGSESVRRVYVETDQESVFAQINSALPVDIECIRLYDEYVAAFDRAAAESK